MCMKSVNGACIVMQGQVYMTGWASGFLEEISTSGDWRQVFKYSSPPVSLSIYMSGHVYKYCIEYKNGYWN